MEEDVDNEIVGSVGCTIINYTIKIQKQTIVLVSLINHFPIWISTLFSN